MEINFDAYEIGKSHNILIFYEFAVLDVKYYKINYVFIEILICIWLG